MNDEEEIILLSGDSTESEPDYDCSPESDGSGCENDDEETAAVRSAPARNHHLKSQNVAALVRGNVEVKRQSLLPRVYSVKDAAAALRKPFKTPWSSGYSENKEQLERRLWARKRFVPWGSTRPVFANITNKFNTTKTIKNDDPEEIMPLPPGIESLVLWQSQESKEGDSDFISINVDPLLVKFLRPHQRYLLK